MTDLVEQPAKVMRIGTMIKQLLEEVRAAPLDEAGRQRLREIHESSIRELETGLAPELRRGARPADPAVRYRRAVRGRAADRPGPARRLARRAVPRHPDRAVRAADGRPRPAGGDAPARAAARLRWRRSDDHRPGRPGDRPSRRRRVRCGRARTAPTAPGSTSDRRAGRAQLRPRRGRGATGGRSRGRDARRPTGERAEWTFGALVRRSPGRCPRRSRATASAAARSC